MFANTVTGLCLGMSFVALLAGIYAVWQIAKKAKFLGQCANARQDMALSLDARRGEQIEELKAGLKNLNEAREKWGETASKPFDTGPLERRIWAAEQELLQLRPVIYGSDERIKILETNGVEERVDALDELRNSLGRLLRPMADDFLPGDGECQPIEDALGAARGIDGKLIVPQGTG